MIANDIGSQKYKMNNEYNNVIIVDSKKTTQSGWKKKQEIARFIRKEIEKVIA
jgi:phosphopantothenoylcysteine decarboxylase/phosphopantothenate--cysteine ligase